TEREKCAALFKSTNKTKGHSIFVYAQLLYAIPTMIYIKFLLVALICGRNRKTRYSSIFYSFISMGALTAVLIHIPRTIFDIIGKRPEWFCPTFRALSQPTYWLDTYVYFIQVWDTLRMLSGTMIVLYRFHSMSDAYSAKRVWESHKASVICGTIVLPTVLYAPIWASPSYAIIDDEEMIFKNEGLDWYNEAVHCCISLVCAIIVLLSQVILLCTRLSSKLIRESIDRSLYFVGLVEIVLIVIYAVFQCLEFARDWFDPSLPSWILYVSLLLSDALGFCPPWALFIASSYI
ncbi:hypothetical protein PMAYCL1PPCAC_09078, partial [Pristionchus mayeri]